MYFENGFDKRPMSMSICIVNFLCNCVCICVCVCVFMCEYCWRCLFSICELFHYYFHWIFC